MYLHESYENHQNKIANLWGSSWQKLTPRQRQLVVEIMNDRKITSNLDALEERVYQMPIPDFVDVSHNSKSAFIFTQKAVNTLTINWQLLLNILSETLITKNSTQVLDILFLELDYIQLNKNTISDVCAITNQTCNANFLIEIDAKLNELKELMKEYINISENKPAQLDYLISEFSTLINLLKNLEVFGIGAFAIAATLRLLLLQQKAAFGSIDLSDVKNQAIEYINYTKSVTPRLFRLSVGRIDKNCKCTKCKSLEPKESTDYECRYFDGKDIHVFRELSTKAGYECNKHRLEMFQTVVEKVNKTAAQPVRSASKKWQELADSL